MKSRLRPILDTVGVTVIILLAVMFYWSMTKRGVLVPTEPIRKMVSVEDTPSSSQGTSAKTDGVLGVASKIEPTSASAARAEPSPPQQNEKVNPAKEEVETKETSDSIDATKSNVTVAEEPAPALRRNPTGGAPERTRPSHSLTTLPEVMPKDKIIANHWMTSTNDRPTIHVAYHPSEIIERLSQRDGLLVASAPDGKGGRQEFRLAGLPKPDGKFVTLTSEVRSQFADFGIALHNVGRIGSIAAPLQRYFDKAQFTVEFVPNPQLATSIFTEVSRAIRTLDQENRQEVIIYGRIHPPGEGRAFSVYRLRWPNGELNFKTHEASN